jgi:hypothetical protein
MTDLGHVVTFLVSVVTQPSQQWHTVVVATKNIMATLLLLNCVSSPESMTEKAASIFRPSLKA